MKSSAGISSSEKGCSRGVLDQLEGEDEKGEEDQLAVRSKQESGRVSRSSPK